MSTPQVPSGTIQGRTSRRGILLPAGTKPAPPRRLDQEWKPSINEEPKDDRD